MVTYVEATVSAGKIYLSTEQRELLGIRPGQKVWVSVKKMKTPSELTYIGETGRRIIMLVAHEGIQMGYVELIKADPDVVRNLLLDDE